MSVDGVVDGPAVWEALLKRADTHSTSPALVASNDVHDYRSVARATAHVASGLVEDVGLRGEDRVVILTQPTPVYVAALVGTWRAGGIAVPLSPGMPAAELDYVVDDASPSVILHDDANAPAVERFRGRPGVEVRQVAFDTSPSTAPPGTPTRTASALMIYTSGTTGRPKGVIHTHGSLAAQVASLQQAWAWSPDDRIPLVLPLHHVHGIVNVLCCALATGATCEMQAGFDPVQVWEAFAAGDSSLFMAVPTVYGRLIQEWDRAPRDTQDRWATGARSLRLMVSGSAALPIDMLERWESITDQRLLERYGMSEVGMALSNTLDERVPGSVGYPLPGVTARLVDDDGHELHGDVEAGHLQLQGPALFREYWRRPDETQRSFVDGWFDTGDDAARQEGRYRLLGRASIDILKSGGEKISALEVEFTYRNHDAIEDLAVVGVADMLWGQRVCAAVVLAEHGDVSPDELRAWGKQHLTAYKVPREFLVVPDLPRNAMGKVVKPEVARLFS